MKASDNEFPSVLFEEHVDPSAPSAGYQRLFVDTDHALKMIDSASAVTEFGAAVTEITDLATAEMDDSLVLAPDGAGGVEFRAESGGGGAVATDTIWDAAGDLAVGSGANTAAKLAIGNAGGALSVVNSAVAWNSGTAFPASKATGDRYWRTDLGREYYWDGTRWVTTQEFILPSTSRNDIATGITASQATMDNAATPGTSCYFTTFRVITYVASANDGSKYWTVELQTLEPDNTPATIGQISTGTTPDGNTTWTQHDVAVNTAITSASYPALRIGATKVSTPGSLIATWNICYRLIAT